ncbi:hypothetical protein JW777_02030 [bacterium]|nr:hypothetical protein [bacterium]
MWENETVVLVVSLKKRIMGGSDKVRFGRIQADNAIPPFIKVIFRNRVEEYLISESPLSFKSTPHFDLKPEDIEGLRGQILDVFRETAIFRQEEVEEILRQALVLRLDYLVKPVRTMGTLLYEKKDRIDIFDLEKRLDPFSKVLPYSENVVKECRRLGYTELEKDEYPGLAADVVRKMAGQDPVKLVLHDFSVLTDFVSETKGEEIGRVGGDVLREFLEDRSMTSFRKAVEVEVKLGKEDFDAADLEMTIKRYLELKETFGSSPAAAASAVERAERPEPADPVRPADRKPAPAPAPAPAPEPVVIEEPEKLEESWDLDSVLGEETPLLAVEPEKEVFEPVEKPKSVKKPMRIIRREQAEEEEEPETADADSLESIDAELISERRGKDSRRPSFRSLIDEKTEKVFVKKLFNGDGDAYGKLMQKLEDAESWRVAKILIDNELFKRDVDPFSREAIKLVDLIYSRYYPEENVGGAKR